MKWMFRLSLLMLLVIGSLYVMGSYQVVRTKEGHEFVERESFKLGETYVDTREWGPIEWIKHPDLLAALTRKKLKKVEKSLSENWSSFTTKFEAQVDDFDLDKKSDKVAKQLDQVRHKAKQKYDALGRQLAKKEITWDGFEKRMDELKKWTEHEISEIKKRAS